jgi:integrase
VSRLFVLTLVEYCLKATLRDIKRGVGTAAKRKAPLLSESIHGVSPAAALDPKGLRDRALLLPGFGDAFRRSELVALDVADLEFTDDGLPVTIRRSKTDQEQLDVTIAIIRGGACCPVKAVNEWLSAARIESGAIALTIALGRISCAAIVVGLGVPGIEASV